MCCFKDYRNFEKLNSMVQDTLSVGIRLVQTLPEDNARELKEKSNEGNNIANWNIKKYEFLCEMFIIWKVHVLYVLGEKKRLLLF